MPNINMLDWPAPDHVKAAYTSRTGGVSVSPYDSFNLGDHVGDNKAHVVANRQILANGIQQVDIRWLTQVHGTHAVDVSRSINAVEADASFSQQKNKVCCIMTADCLPVFFCDLAGTQVAVAHAGWRGLLEGVLQNTLAVFDEPKQVIAYLGPAISQQAFEVGNEVRAAFLAYSSTLNPFFIPSTQSSKWMADLYGIARSILQTQGVSAVYGGTRCTYSERDDFFSYRRDGVTGRMANLIWLEA
jgi:polyphenol oxidase